AAGKRMYAEHGKETRVHTEKIHPLGIVAGDERSRTRRVGGHGFERCAARLPLGICTICRKGVGQIAAWTIRPNPEQPNGNGYWRGTQKGRVDKTKKITAPPPMQSASAIVASAVTPGLRVSIRRVNRISRSTRVYTSRAAQRLARHSREVGCQDRISLRRCPR